MGGEKKKKPNSDLTLALVVPKKRTLEELVNSKNVKSLVPPLPREVAVSFYLQSWKLIFAVYHMVTDKGVSR